MPAIRSPDIHATTPYWASASRPLVIRDAAATATLLFSQLLMFSRTLAPDVRPISRAVRFIGADEITLARGFFVCCLLTSVVNIP